MSVIDDWAERHIQEALNKGELKNLKGEGQPLLLDDDSQVPPELRAGYRILKTQGICPRITVPKRCTHVGRYAKGLAHDDPNYQPLSKQLSLLELKLKQANINTDFLHGEYEAHIRQRFKPE